MSGCKRYPPCRTVKTLRVAMSEALKRKLQKSKIVDGRGVNVDGRGVNVDGRVRVCCEAVS
eukprot:9370419-Pyramimonas_sp.AAC.2